MKSVRGHNNMGPNASLPVLRQTRAAGSGDSIFYVSDYLRKRKRPLKGPQLLLKRYCLTVTNATAKRDTVFLVPVRSENAREQLSRR